MFVVFISLAVIVPSMSKSNGMFKFPLVDKEPVTISEPVGTNTTGSEACSPVFFIIHFEF